MPHIMRISMHSIKQNVWGVLLAVVAISIAPAGLVRAQGTEQSTEQQAQPTQMNLTDSLREARAENAARTAVLRSIRSIDTARQNELIQWIITDRTVRSRVISALRKDGYPLSPNSVAEMTVTQVPPNDLNDYQMQLIRVVIEGAGVYGQPTIERVLGSALYDEINSRTGYQYTLISTEPEQQNIQFVAMNASALRRGHYLQIGIWPGNQRWRGLDRLSVLAAGHNRDLRPYSQRHDGFPAWPGMAAWAIGHGAVRHFSGASNS